jgi:hypothetical protein
LDSPDGLVKNILKAFLGQGRTFQIPDGVDLLRALNTLWVGYGCHSLLTQSLNSFGVIAQVELGSDENDRNVRCVVGDFWVPL